MPTNEVRFLIQFVLLMIAVSFGQFIPSQLSGSMAAKLECQITGRPRFSDDYRRMRSKAFRFAYFGGMFTTVAVAGAAGLIRKDGIHWWLLIPGLLAGTIVHLVIYRFIYSRELRK